MPQQTKHLIGDRLHPAANLIGAYGLPALTAEQDGFITNLNPAKIGNIDQGQVHGNPADDRRTPTMQQDPGPVGQNTEIAVLIAYRQDGQPCGSFVAGTPPDPDAPYP